jgi:hypothetical protein
MVGFANDPTRYKFPTTYKNIIKKYGRIYTYDLVAYWYDEFNTMCKYLQSSPRSICSGFTEASVANSSSFSQAIS